VDDKIKELKDILWKLDDNHNVSVTRTQENINEAARKIVKLFAIPVVSFNEERVAVCYNQGCVDQLSGNCHHTLEKYKRCKSKQT